jgi:hypothetical protein
MSKDTKIELQAIGILLLLLFSSFLIYFLFVFIFYFLSSILGITFNIWLGGILLLMACSLIPAFLDLKDS